MTDRFIDKLIKVIEKRETLLCVGLDPQMDIPFEDDVESIIFNFNKNIIEQTIQYAACYKPNIAFYEQFGPEGVAALKKSMDLIPSDTPVIIDSKRGDIGNTATAYAKSIFGDYNADATTLSPYLGKESILPFLEYSGKGLFVLCRTSNPGSDMFQNQDVIDKTGVRESYYIKLAREIGSWSPDIGLVVAGNNPEALKAVRSVCPETWILAPGIGAQGGTVEAAIQNGMGKDGHNILLNVSRGISSAPVPGKAAKEIRDQINDARQKHHFFMADREEEKKKNLIKDIINEGCFKIGKFTLKSGLESPFYLDLRKLISNPDLLYRSSEAYSSLMKGLDFKRIAGIPFAAISTATCISLQLQKPLVFPRLQKKAHGTGNSVEGNYEKGEKVILVDDLITTGKSKIEALEILKEAGLEVTDLVVLVERGVQGRKDMEDAGINLHSYLKIEDFLTVCLEMELIDDTKLEEINQFIANS